MMPERKLIARMRAYLDLGSKRRKKKADELEALIKKIRKRERAMIAKCRHVKGSKECELMKKRYRILHAQRKKGQKALKLIRHK
jgi:exoribonuclease R